MIIIRNVSTNPRQGKKGTGKRSHPWLILLWMILLATTSARAQFQKLTEKVSLAQKQTTALKVIEALDRQSNYSFTFAQEQLAAITIPEFTVENIPLGDALVLLQKTLLNIEGLGRQLDPNLDLWKTAKPFLERWTREQMGPRAFLRGMRKNIPFLMEKLPELPELLYTTLRKVEAGEINLVHQTRQLIALRAELRAANRRTVYVIFAVAVAIVTSFAFLA